ncbi:MAG: Nif3-like dinuclear metal center hexameric protein [Candidatus Hydrogenedentota bacterium]
MTVLEICDAIDELAPPPLAYSWDRAGLGIGDPYADVTGVVVSLSVTRDTYTAARRTRSQLIVSHHPVIWDPLNALRTDDPHTRLCLDLAEAGISCYAAHTNLDLAPGGVSHVAAKRLKLNDVAPLLPVEHARQVKLVTFVPESHLAPVRNAVCRAGAGVIGDYTFCSFSAPGVGTFLPGEKSDPFSGRKRVINEEPERRFEVLAPKARLSRIVDAMLEAHPYDEPAFDIVTLESADPASALGVKGDLHRAQPLGAFAKFVRRALGATHVRVVGDSDMRVHTVAVIGGSGGGQIARIPHDVDVLVTGDVKYHDAQAAEERGLAVIDAGHAATEKWIVPWLVSYLRSRFRRLRVAPFVEPELFRVVTK